MKEKKSMYNRVNRSRESMRLTAKTFEEYRMPGIASAVLADKNGLLRHVGLGSDVVLDGAMKYLLNE